MTNEDVKKTLKKISYKKWKFSFEPKKDQVGNLIITPNDFSSISIAFDPTDKRPEEIHSFVLGQVLRLEENNSIELFSVK